MQDKAIQRAENDEKIVSDLLKNTNRPLCISDIFEITKIPRTALRITLAKLEGAEKVEAWNIGNARVYKWKKD